MAQVAKIPPMFPTVGRVLENDPSVPVIRYEAPVVSEHVKAFSKVIGYDRPGIPPTFYTFFRWGEFEWLRRLGIPLEQIVHTEQSYSYHSRVDAGVVLIAETEVSRFRERKSLKMITMTTKLCYGDRLVAISETSFLASAREAK